MTTYWRGTSSIPSNADCADVCGRVRAFWNSFAAQMASGVLIVPPQAVDTLNEATGELDGSKEPGSLASVSASGTSSMASASMVLLRLTTQTIINGRRLQGRSFLGPVGTNTNTAGNVSSTCNAAVLTAAALLNTGATASKLVVWHRPTEPTPTDGQVGDVTGFGTSPEYAVLRSRRS
jgi:hypothetical protein